ncbi:CAP domain-containing protein [Streptomyces sp. NPDC092296]|uniref:CAP domain-containing protein n=1 Tax=Streptomyces sp. NPDC092296 TaxID=3366012 RepID=UPI00381C4034
MGKQRSIVHRRSAAAAAACLLVLAGSAGPASARGRGGGAKDATARVLALVNGERREAGCRPLTLDRRLSESARQHSRDMAYRHWMSHLGSDGSQPVDRIRDTGYRALAWGENVAQGFRTARGVVDAWMTSPGHRENILDCGYAQTGIGLAEPGDYWTQDFGAAR